jgi:hypothetical protein
VYVHCFNHRINLITVDICKGLAHGKTFFDLLEALYVFISDSAVHTKFIETQVLLNPKRKPIELKKNCYTRWTAQVQACSAFKGLKYLYIFLNKLIVDKNDRAPEASKQYQINFNVIFNLCMYENI